MGMGGSLAFEAAIVRTDLEAAVAFSGFPQRYLGRFKEANTPILAFYGTKEPLIPADVIEQLQQELAQSPLPHKVVILEGAPHDIFTDRLPEEQRVHGRSAWHQMLAFLEEHLEGPTRPPERQVF
jgi:dienelactone hydrolase